MGLFLKRIMFLVLVSNQVFAQLPPVFGDEYKSRATKTETIKTYLIPKKIIWKSDDTNTYLKDTDNLLKKGSGQVAVNDENLFHFISDETNKPSLILDYGKEIHGGIKISMGIRPSKKPFKLRVRFGESVTETLSDIGGDKNATNEHSLRDFIIEVPWLGSIEIGETGFRFVRLDVVEANEDAPIKSIEAAFVYRDLPYLGSFNSSDDRLNEIWETGAYTVHLNMQKYLWDGIKRDRLVWVGDMHPEVMTINTVFGKNNIVPKTLDLARDQYPLPQWMNTISSYSMWWLLIHKNWFDYHGDLAYLKEQEEYMINLLDQLSEFVDKHNKEILNGVRFLDWPTSTDPKAVHAGLQAMMVMTFDAGSEIMEAYGNKDLKKKYANIANKLKKHKPKGNTTKQAAAMLAIAGLESPKKINKEILIKNGVSGMSTFYGYYVLEAMAKANDYNGAIDVIKKYWGGMLDLGATTFWEDFDINDAVNTSRIDEMPKLNTKDIHGDFGEFCYVGFRHSLAHGWASGPTPWLTQYVLGINVKDGGDTIVLKPNLGKLKYAKGTFPTKYGILTVSHVKKNNKVVTTFEAPKGLKVLN